jgi:hypothetical protein
VLLGARLGGVQRYEHPHAPWFEAEPAHRLLALAAQAAGGAVQQEAGLAGQ